MRDVIIVGAGAGGAVVAKELAARGLDILLLEAGLRLEDSETALQPTVVGALSSYGWKRPHIPSTYVTDAAPPSFRGSNAGVGGTTLTYTGNHPRPHPGVFADYSGADAGAYDVAHRFSFGYEALRPYFQWVEATLPVQTAPMDKKAEQFFRAARAIGLPRQTGKDVVMDSYRPQENAILQPQGTAGLHDVPRSAVDNPVAWPAARGCTFCGYCNQGCAEPFGAPLNQKAKRSVNHSYIPMALTADAWASASGGKAAEIIAEAFVTNLELDSSTGVRGRVRAVTWRDARSGESRTEEATVVVLSAGAIETPRLWLNSGLPDTNGLVGTGYTDHFADLLIGILDEPTYHSRGPVSNARADFPGRGAFENQGVMPEYIAAFLTHCAGGVTGHHGPYDGSFDVTDVGADGASGRYIAEQLTSVLGAFDRLMTLFIMTDDDVVEDNRVALSPLPRDEHGRVPLVDIRRRSARSVANREFLAERATALLRAAGASQVLRSNFLPAIVHSASTMRMATSASAGVVDAHGESFEVAGLFIADNSVLPNALGGANPTHTTQTLATRSAEAIFTRYFGGKGWVADEAPLASTDDAVTAALAGLHGER